MEAQKTLKPEQSILNRRIKPDLSQYLIPRHATEFIKKNKAQKHCHRSVEEVTSI